MIFCFSEELGEYPVRAAARRDGACRTTAPNGIRLREAYGATGSMRLMGLMRPVSSVGSDVALAIF